MLRNSCIIPQHAFPLQDSKQKFRGSQEFQTVEFPLKSKKKCALSGTTSLFNKKKVNIIRCLLRTAKMTISFVMSVGPSLHPHGTRRSPLDRFS